MAKIYLFSHTHSVEIYSICRFDYSVEYGIRYCRILSKYIIPVLDRKLAGYDCRLSPVPVFYKLHKVKQLLSVKYRKRPVKCV